MTGQGVQGGLHRGEGAEAVHPGLGPVAGHVIVDQCPGLGFRVTPVGGILRQIDDLAQVMGHGNGVFDVIAGETSLGITAAGGQQETQAEDQGDRCPGQLLDQSGQGGDHGLGNIERDFRGAGP